MALDDLIRYESAAVAGSNVKKDNQLAVVAMQDFYENIGLGEDPIINKALQEGAAGGETALSSLGLLQAVQVYGGKYESAFAQTKFSDLVGYLTQGYNIPGEAKEAFGKYNDNTLLELSKKAEAKEISNEDKQNIGRAVQAISILKERRLRAKTLDIYNKLTQNNLEALYPKKESEESE